MKRTLLICLILRGSFICRAQQLLAPCMNNDLNSFPYQPLTVIRMPGQPVKLIQEVNTKNSFFLKDINPAWIKAISTYNEATATELYGPDGKHACIVLDLKKQCNFSSIDTSAINVSELKINHIPIKQLTLPVYIDSIYVKYPEDVYLKKTDIRSVTENKDALDGVLFISIITYSEIIARKPGAIPIKNQTDSKNIQLFIRGE